MHLVLASGSPRRHQLLQALGLAFTVRAPDVDETPRPAEAPATYVRRIAADKVEAAHVGPARTIAADTTVDVDGVIVGKPTDPAEAVDMLRRLAGREHVVHTAVAVHGPAGLAIDVASATVTMAPLDDERIEWYVATGEPLDKAGAYGLQGLGGVFVTAVDGDPFTVVGLPLALTRSLCAKAGFELLDHRP